jgi:hypothetical protein
MQIEKIKLYAFYDFDYVGKGVKHTNTRKSIRKAHRKMFVELLRIMSSLFGEQTDEI